MQRNLQKEQSGKQMWQVELNATLLDTLIHARQSVVNGFTTEVINNNIYILVYLAVTVNDNKR